MKAALFGAGFAGEVHAAALKSCGIELAAVVTRSPASAAAFAEKWSIPRFGTDAALAFAEDIDVVHICTPPTTHGTIVRACLEHKKHIICEKPLSLSVEEAEELAARSEKSGLLCAVTFNVRYHQACRRAKEILDSGILGRPLVIHGNYLQEFNAFPAPLDWRYDPSLAGDMRAVTEIGSHWFDIAQYISGEKIQAVSALFGRFHPERILEGGIMYPVKESCGKKTGQEPSEPAGTIRVHSEDAAAINMKFENGAIGSVLLSEISPGRGNRLTLEITCEQGNLWWNEEENNVLYHATKNGGIRQEIFAFGNGFGDTFTDFLKDVYRHTERLQSGTASEDAVCEKSMWPGFREGAEIAAICQAAYDSDRDDSRWVTVRSSGRGKKQ